MTSNLSKVYDTVAKENGLNKELVKSIGDALFSELRHKMQFPEHLGYTLPRLGKFVISYTNAEKRYKRLISLDEHISKGDSEEYQKFLLKLCAYQKVMHEMERFNQEKQVKQQLKDERRKSNQSQSS